MNTVKANRVLDRVMSVKLEIEGMMINVICSYFPQAACEMEERKKEKFCSEFGEVLTGIPREERVVIGAEFNGHVYNKNRREAEVIGRFCVKERNLETQMIIDFFQDEWKWLW